MADNFIFLNDAALSKGSYTPRCQVYAARDQNYNFLSLPISNQDYRKPIKQIMVDAPAEILGLHKRQLQSYYYQAPHITEVLEFLDQVSKALPPQLLLDQLNIHLITNLCSSLQIAPNTSTSATTPSDSKATQRLIDLIESKDGSVYLSGKGFDNYRDDALWEASGLNCITIDFYQNFQDVLTTVNSSADPRCSILDTIAKHGFEGCQELIVQLQEKIKRDYFVSK